MRHVPRLLEAEVRRAARAFPTVLLTGPRRSGKTTLLRRLLPDASYALLEDPEIVARVRQDPRGFLDGVRLPAVLDEIQNVPEILGHVRARVDREPRRMGRWYLTGSQEAPLMKGVTESMAGRAAVLHLPPLSRLESPKVTLFGGGFPEAIAAPRAVDLWFRSYVQTYLERDVRAVASIRDLATFRRFMVLLAARTGGLLNRTDIAAPLGVSVPTVTQWTHILEATGLILLVPPYFENLGKRLVKSPKVYWADSGLAAHLLGIETPSELDRSPFLGPLFKGFVAAEVLKLQAGTGRRRELYHFRDQQGLEVDFVVPGGAGRWTLIEAKASHTARPADGEPVARLARAFKDRRPASYLVHRPTGETAAMSALLPGVRAIGLDGLLQSMR